MSLSVRSKFPKFDNAKLIFSSVIAIVMVILLPETSDDILHFWDFGSKNENQTFH